MDSAELVDQLLQLAWLHLWWDWLDVDDDGLEAEVVPWLEEVVVEVDGSSSFVDEGGQDFLLVALDDPGGGGCLGDVCHLEIVWHVHPHQLLDCLDKVFVGDDVIAFLLDCVNGHGCLVNLLLIKSMLWAELARSAVALLHKLVSLGHPVCVCSHEDHRHGLGEPVVHHLTDLVVGVNSLEVIQDIIHLVDVHAFEVDGSVLVNGVESQAYEFSPVALGLRAFLNLSFLLVLICISPVIGELLALVRSATFPG